MTEDNGNKLTLSGKTTLTLKKTNMAPKGEGKKVVQVEVRKKRFVSQPAPAKSSVEIDESLIGVLNDLFGEAENFTLINSDVLKLDLNDYIKNERAHFLFATYSCH